MCLYCYCLQSLLLVADDDDFLSTYQLMPRAYPDPSAGEVNHYLRRPLAAGRPGQGKGTRKKYDLARSQTVNIGGQESRSARAIQLTCVGRAQLISFMVMNVLLEVSIRPNGPSSASNIKVGRNLCSFTSNKFEYLFPLSALCSIHPLGRRSLRLSSRFLLPSFSLSGGVPAVSASAFALRFFLIWTFR